MRTAGAILASCLVLAAAPARGSEGCLVPGTTVTKKLARAGVATDWGVAQAVASPAKRARLAKATGMTPVQLATLADRCALHAMPDIVRESDGPRELDPATIKLLNAAMIDGVGMLARARRGPLAVKLAETSRANPALPKPPSETVLQTWIDSARRISGWLPETATGLPPSPTRRAFAHICEAPRLPEIARAVRLPVAVRDREPVHRTLCVLGNLGLERANIYLEPTPPTADVQPFNLYDTDSPGSVASLAPAMTITIGEKGMVLRCKGCDPTPRRLRATADRGWAVWLELEAGRLMIREHAALTELTPPGGIPIEKKLHLAVPTAEPDCEECNVLALEIYLTPKDSAAWLRAVKTRRKR